MVFDAEDSAEVTSFLICSSICCAASSLLSSSSLSLSLSSESESDSELDVDVESSFSTVAFPLGTVSCEVLALLLSLSLSLALDSSELESDDDFVVVALLSFWLCLSPSSSLLELLSSLSLSSSDDSEDVSSFLIFCSEDPFLTEVVRPLTVGLFAGVVNLLSLLDFALSDLVLDAGVCAILFCSSAMGSFLVSLSDPESESLSLEELVSDPESSPVNVFALTLGVCDFVGPNKPVFLEPALGTLSAMLRKLPLGAREPAMA